MTVASGDARHDQVVPQLGVAVDASLDESHQRQPGTPPATADRPDPTLRPADSESIPTASHIERSFAALPWDRAEGFIPRTIRGRLASALLADPTVNEPLLHVVPRVAAARRLTILIAREKLGKSTLAAYCASCVTAGVGVFGGEPIPSARVLWIELEEPTGDAVQRFERMQAVGARVCVIDRLEGNNAVDAIVAEMEAFAPALVVVDSLAVLARSRGLAEKSEEGWTDLITVLRHAAQTYGSAIILLHHARKSDGEYRGSTAIAAAADQLVTMSEDDKDSSIRRMVARGRWPIPNYSIRYDEETAAFELVPQHGDRPMDDDAEPTRRMLELLRANPGEGKTAICERMGMQAKRARMLFDKLHEQGFIVDGPTGRGYAVAGEYALDLGDRREKGQAA